MPSTIREALEELRHDVDDLKIAPASVVRRRGAVRERRARLAVAAAVTATGVVIVPSAYIVAQWAGPASPGAPGLADQPSASAAPSGPLDPSGWPSGWPPSWGPSADPSRWPSWDPSLGPPWEQLTPERSGIPSPCRTARPGDDEGIAFVYLSGANESGEWRAAHDAVSRLGVTVSGNYMRRMPGEGVDLCHFPELAKETDPPDRVRLIVVLENGVTLQDVRNAVAGLPAVEEVVRLPE